MKPKQIKKLRRIIQSYGYLILRWQLMWAESDAWWEDWLLSREEKDMKNSIMFRKRAEWYSKRLNSNDTH